MYVSFFLEKDLNFQQISIRKAIGINNNIQGLANCVNISGSNKVLNVIVFSSSSNCKTKNDYIKKWSHFTSISEFN